MVSRKALAEASKRAEEARAEGLFAVSASYDPRSNRIWVKLKNGLGMAFDPGQTAGLGKARPEDLDPIEISPSGLGLHFPKIDADVYLPEVLARMLAPFTGRPTP